MGFENNVFINCPFDSDYTPLLRTLLFTTVYLNLIPKISQTKSSSEVRIVQIKQLIKDSKYSIHDLSRSRPLKKNDLPRMNMPYELGLDSGCIEYGGRKFKEKKILILATDKYFYQKVLSDIAGQDIENHNDDPLTIIKKIRDWISRVDEKNASHPGTNEIWLAYNQFNDDLETNLLTQGYLLSEIQEMSASEYIKFAYAWIANLKS